jgi:hypothetical protein
MANLIIGKYVCIQKPIGVKSLELDMNGKEELHINKLGEPLKKIQISKSEFKWVNEKTGTEISKDDVYKSFKGKPINSFSKTKQVKEEAIEVIDLVEILMNSITQELSYQLICSDLKTALKQMPGKAMSFKYTNSGFKVHRAVVYYNEKKDAILMKCVRGTLDKVDLSEINTKEVEAEDDVGQIDLGTIDI